MEILILVAIFALLIVGPRRNGRPHNTTGPPSPSAR